MERFPEMGYTEKQVPHKTVHHIRAIQKRLDVFRRERPSLFWLRVGVIVLLGVFFLFKRNFWTPDTLFAVFLVVFIVMGQARNFLVRFAPFVLLLLAYDSFRGIADDLNTYVNYWPMISFDQNVFGILPTETLQQWWWHGSLQWYDFYFYFLYTLHFLMPVALAILIWKLHPRLYWQFVAALVGLSFAAFITYIIFPAAPPWLASDLHMIEPIHRISTDLWFAMGIDDPSALYNKLSPNLVAAVPSLHSAYPMLFTLFIWRMFTIKKTWWVGVYPLSMWVGVVYLGEHYVFDVIFGAGYAIIAYFVAERAFVALRAYHPTFKKDYQRGYAYARAVVDRK
jgi:membrane-associated phospholipid phosphatase